LTAYVVDASVAAKWLFVEEHSDRAAYLWRHNEELRAPDFLHIELTNVVRTKVLRRQYPRELAAELPGLLSDFPLILSPSRSLLPPALDLAIQHSRSVYDSLYLALAARYDCPLVTADRRFYNALIDLFPGHLTWVGDLEGAAE
jgi:predicted nucleic acid-binding protein